MSETSFDRYADLERALSDLAPRSPSRRRRTWPVRSGPTLPRILLHRDPAGNGPRFCNLAGWRSRSWRCWSSSERAGLLTGIADVDCQAPGRARNRDHLRRGDPHPAGNARRHDPAARRVDDAVPRRNLALIMSFRYRRSLDRPDEVYLRQLTSRPRWSRCSTGRGPDSPRPRNGVGALLMQFPAESDAGDIAKRVSLGMG